MAFVPEGLFSACDTGTKCLWSLDIFLCEFQAPDGRTENSPGLQPGFKRLSEKGVLG